MVTLLASSPASSPFDNDDVMLGDCYGGSARGGGTYFVLSPSEGVVVIVPDTGDQVDFIDESPLQVTSLKTGRHADREAHPPIVAWTDDEGLLVIVYGDPIAGSAVRVDLQNRTVRTALGFGNDAYEAGAVCYPTHTLPYGPRCLLSPPRPPLRPTFPCLSPEGSGVP
jgi:hypothetical protein